LIAGNPKILIADESLQDLRIHASTLRKQGYEVSCARGGEDTLKILESMIPDLFLIDTAMRDMDGYELCRRLKQNTVWRSIPVIFITDNRSPENIDQGYASGGVDYIVKPCHLSEFLSRVRTQIKLYQLVRQNEEMQATAIDANPLTRLPGNNSIQKAIQQAIDDHLDVGIIHTDLATPTVSSLVMTCSSSMPKSCTPPCGKSVMVKDSWGTSAGMISWSCFRATR